MLGGPIAPGSQSAPYVGRFAPSPTGPLHIGSLVTAVASFLAARQAGGRWLVRIEDIDPPREVPGAADQILRTLEQLSLHWDDTVLFQSARIDAYRELADRLLADGMAYRCSCTRSELRRQAGKAIEPLRYPGNCKRGHRPGAATAIRAVAPKDPVEFTDRLQGVCSYPVDAMTGDYVIYRRDGLPAYHLAVVADDAYQEISHIVRGTDLLESTPLHIHLQRLLALPTPAYAHVPIVVDAQLQKLSKQTGAKPIDAGNAADAARQALHYLGAAPPHEIAGAPAADLWEWAQECWTLDSTKGIRHVCQDTDPMVEQRPID